MGRHSRASAPRSIANTRTLAVVAASATTVAVVLTSATLAFPARQDDQTLPVVQETATTVQLFPGPTSPEDDEPTTTTTTRTTTPRTPGEKDGPAETAATTVTPPLTTTQRPAPSPSLQRTASTAPTTTTPRAPLATTRPPAPALTTTQRPPPERVVDVEAIPTARPTTTRPTTTPAPPPLAVDKIGPACARSGFNGVRPHVAQVGFQLRLRYGIALSDIIGVASRNNASDHPVGRALDFLVPRATGDALAAYALANRGDFAITYVIWRQRINYGSGWQPMADRGSDTANHYDHVHVSFAPTGSGANIAC